MRDFFEEGVLVQALWSLHSVFALSAQAALSFPAQAALSLQHFSPANTGKAATAANVKQTMIFFISVLDSCFQSLFKWIRQI